jgi:peptidoglycan/xylan/chitin deacetylase (PgdA/CDA1 family)
MISLTFDDGLWCQFESALPILNSHGMPATFFLIANRNPTHDLWSGHTMIGGKSNGVMTMLPC